MRRLLSRLVASTVWAPNGVTREAWRFRGIYRFVLPASNVLFFYFGAVGAVRGVGSVQDAAGDTWQTWWSAGIAVSAVFAFIGISFPRLWPVEAIAKTVLIGHVSVYIALFLLRGWNDPGVTATAGLMIILLLLPIWRLGDLGYVWFRSKESGDTR